MYSEPPSKRSSWRDPNRLDNCFLILNQNKNKKLNISTSVCTVRKRASAAAGVIPTG
jgi:hypothetical protein